MATLNNLATQVKRKLGLSQGSHSLTFTTNTVDADTITINGIKLILRATPAAAEFNLSRASTTANAMATAFKASIDSGFGVAQGITASTPSGATVELIGARTVESSNNAGCIVTISDTEMEPPVFSDIMEWIKEGQLDVTNKSNDQLLMAEATEMVGDATIETNSSSTELTAPTNFLRPLVLRYMTRIAGDRVTRAEKIPYDLLMDIKDDRHPFYSKTKNPEEGNKWYAIFNGKIQLPISVNVLVDAEIIYIKKPQTVGTTECDLPESLEKLVVDYACYKSLISIGKEEESQIYFQQYLLDLQSLNLKYMPEDKNTHESKPALNELKSKGI
jgi:hypothetical protein